MKELLDFAESEGKENIRNHLASAENLAKEASTTLTVLLVVSSGALAYTVKLANAQGAAFLFSSLAVVTAYLFVLCAVLVLKCLTIGEFPNTANEPANLYQTNFKLQQIREAELKNLQARIKQAAYRNSITAAWLNRIRLAATITPIIAVLAFIVAAAQASPS